MNKSEILTTFKQLARSQGLYDRILSNLEQLEPDDFNSVMDQLEAQNFSDALDLVMFIEC